MTEAEWAACCEPETMLDFVRATGKLSERKARLFAVAVCRRIWPLLTDESSRKAVEVAEQFADGRVTEQELDVVRDAAWEFSDYSEENIYHPDAADAPAWAADRHHRVEECALRAAIAAQRATDGTEASAQASLLRDVFGGSSAATPRIDPFWLCWSDRKVVRLAQAIYDDRRWGDMSILADALRDAGCNIENILSHCRQQEGHVRGCWVIDQILGKS